MFPKRLLAAGLDLLAPERCALCGMNCGMNPHPGLCRQCVAELAANDPACPRCALPLRSATGSPGQPCGQCQLHQPLFHRAVAPLLYREPLSLLLHRFKFGGATRLARPLAGLMASAALATLRGEDAPTLLLPMPLHWWRHWRRGFNQAELLGLELVRLARSCGLQLRLDRRSCSRARATRPQVGLDRQEREANLRAAFHCKPLAGGPRVAIIDDIVTTGASANALAEVVIAAGASQVDLWACARTPE